MRVAVAQFATSFNIQENLTSCLRMINEAALCEPSLIVLPEFCNIQPSYVDHNQTWHEALSINGAFLQQIAQQAQKYHCFIVLGVTLRRDQTRDHKNAAIKSNITITSCLFSPTGALIYQGDKRTLQGLENDFFIRASNAPEIVTTPFGMLGLLAGSDGVGFETGHELALAGAKLLCNSQSSFALDQSTLHDLALACENNLFVATANKVGSLLQDKQTQSTVLNRQGLVPQQYCRGAGQSQIVSADGKVLAKLANDKEGFVFADINLAEAGINHKCRPDGTEISQQRRPELYQAQKLSKQRPALDHSRVPETANVAIFATYTTNEQAIEDVCHYIENNLSDIIQLPELFFISDKAITNNAEQLGQIADISAALIKRVSAVLRPFQYVCTSLVIDGAHRAVLISEHGLFATQPQLHFCNRYQWTALGDNLNIIELPLEQGFIKVAMLTADDANVPEIVKLAALNNIQLLLVPFDIQESCEVEYSLLSRASENKICIVAASREKSFAHHAVVDNNNAKNTKKIKPQKSTGLIANLTTELFLLAQFKSGKFNGYINKPLVKHQHGKITKAVIYPMASIK